MQETKKCPQCKEVKSLDQFHDFRYGKGQGYCKVCAAKYSRKYREANKDKINRQQRERYAAMREAYAAMQSK